MADYSLTTLLNDLLRLQNNSLEMINALSTATTSQSDTVDVKILNSANVLETVKIPSFGYLKNQMNVIDATVKNLAGIGDANSNVRLSDGSFRKILVSNLQKEASNITSLSKPNTFNKKENWFFESFLNPLLYVSFNLTNQIKFNTENVEVSRYMLNLDTASKLSIFNTNFLNKSDINYSTFLQIINDNNITYFLDKNTVETTPRTLQYFGNFTVTDVKDDTITEVINGETIYKKLLSIKIDKLTYSDSSSAYLNTKQLKIGDSLVVNSGNKNTRYEILSVDSSTRTVKVRLVEGFDAITMGSDVLSYYAVDSSDVIVDVNVGFNERSVIFVKAIDPDSKILATQWSPGVGFYTNDLTIVDTNGNTVNLATYYQNEVVDFGSYLYSAVKDKTVPAAFGIAPEPPTLLSSNFKVLQINEHLNSTISNDIAKKQYDKTLAQSQIASLDKTITDLKTKIATTTYSTDQLRKTDESSLNNLITQRQSQSGLYSSLVDEINTLTNSQNSDITPKYRVRGFFPFPTPKNSARTGNQEVIQFLIQYRYIGKDGSANQPQQISYVDTDGQTRRGTFSNWIEYTSPIRSKAIDVNTGNFYWTTDQTENADIVNINQVDIPINVGESVEFRIKSISEAGWPVNPYYSSWTDIVKIDFPSELESIQNISTIAEQAKAEKVKIELLSDLSNMNIDTIAGLSFTQNGNFYANDSKHVASGFLTAENNIISLFDKLNDMDKQLQTLQSLIQNAKGNLAISIIDEYGQEYKVDNNTTLKIYAGNYKDQVNSLQVKKGAIVTKTYLIKLANDAASSLELYSRMYGSKTLIVAGAAGDTDYENLRKYDKVPMGISKTYPKDLITDNLPNQSAQVKGQYLYGRYMSVDGVNELYMDPSFLSGSVNGNGEYLPASDASSGTDGFAWSTSDGGIIIPNAMAPGKFYIHKNHPDIPSWKTESGGSHYSAVVEKYVRNSALAGDTSTSNYFKQLAYHYNSTQNSKICFLPNDQYLIGTPTVGAYLFLNPNSHDDLAVDGNDALSTKILQYGSDKAITIPVVFQYRMTDYYGDGDNGLGNIGGDINFNTSSNLEYTKRIGIDIYNNLKDNNRFSFDIEITARYSSKSMSNTSIPTRSFENAISDLTGVVKTANPKLNRPASK